MRTMALRFLGPIWCLAIERWALFVVWLVLRLYATTRPKVTIAQGTITRWFLTSRPSGNSTGPEGYYLHRINGPDTAKDEHCHPWRNADTLVLRGWYADVRSGVPHRHCTGSRSVFPPAMYHRTTAVGANTWTLFRAGPKSGLGWGFRAHPGAAMRRAPAVPRDVDAAERGGT